MRGLALCLAALWSVSSFAATESAPDSEAGITTTSTPRSATLLGTLELDATWRTSASIPLKLSDSHRFALAETPMALDQGGAVGSDLRKILALILGFVPGFGLGHLIARDRDGFILFLIIDIALYVAGFAVGYVFFKGGLGWGLGGVIWLVVHIIQALDAYAEAGGERLVQDTRERAVEVAHRNAPVLQPAQVTTRVFSLNF